MTYSSERPPSGSDASRGDTRRRLLGLAALLFASAVALLILMMMWRTRSKEGELPSVEVEASPPLAPPPLEPAESEEKEAEPRSIVFRMAKVGGDKEQEADLELVAELFEPREVELEPGESVESLLRRECGLVTQSMLRRLRAINGDLPDRPEPGATMRVPACPSWREAREEKIAIVIPKGSNLSNELRRVVGVGGSDTVNQVMKLNGLEDPRKIPAGKRIRVPRVTEVVAYKLRSDFADRPQTALERLRQATGLVAAGLDSAYQLIHPLEELKPADAQTCEPTALPAAWPYDSYALLEALRHNEENHFRRRLAQYVLVSVGDSGTFADETRIPYHFSTKEGTGRPDYDDDGNGHKDDVVGTRVLEGRGPPAPYLDYEKRAHGTAVSGLAAGGLTQGELRDAVSKRIGLKSLNLVEELPTPTGRRTHRWPFSAASKALTYTSDRRPIEILNLSLESEVEDDAFFQLLYSIEILVVAAAGNAEEETQKNLQLTPTFPANYSADFPRKLITVTAHGVDLRLPSFAKRAKEYVDIAAPGCRVPSLAVEGGTSEWVGTSFAAPLVTFAAALIRSEGVPLRDIKPRILASANYDYRLQPEIRSGGRLNIERAVSVWDDLVELRTGKLLKGEIEARTLTIDGQAVLWGKIRKVVMSPNPDQSGRHLVVTVGARGRLNYSTVEIGTTQVSFRECGSNPESEPKKILLSAVREIIPGA